MYYTIIGTQWGDEGKGKIVDWLASRADIVARFQGGNNAGHTIQIANKTYKLNLLPSGIIRGKKCIIGNGVILDPWALKNEIKTLKEKKIKINSNNLIISDNICLILSMHKAIDSFNEELRGNQKIGTTKKGIGPAYEDKVGRRSIRLCDLNDTRLLEKKIIFLNRYHKSKLKLSSQIKIKKTLNELKKINNFLKEFSKPTWKILDIINNKKKKILFEGAQGALLDLDFGTYPYVTSSNTTTGQIFAGTGFSNRKNHKILGVTKAYTTRVGSGPFPTEQKNKIGEYLSIKGKEIGTVTKRKRRCGWFDAILARQSMKINGVNSIVLTKLDVLDELEKIKVCTGYMINKKKYEYLPSSEYLQKKVKPIYKVFNGWKSSTYGISKWSDLPKNAKIYLSFLENFIKIKIIIISTGPERKQTIDKKNLLGKI